MVKKDVLDESSKALREISSKLRSMAYLIGQCGSDPCVPLDSDEIFGGIEAILTQLHTEIRDISNSIEL